MAGSELVVLLCTYNGEQFLEQQLDSITSQEGVSCRVIVSDDASSDSTSRILQRAFKRGVIASLRQGPGRGHAANFMSLVCAGDIDGSFFAYADQDDVWDHDKLARALDRLACVDASIPALYCSRSRTLAQSGAVEGASPLFTRPPSFANALIQNIGGGNTMVFNAAARELLRQAGPVDVVSHDWWTYLLISGAGGKVIYDPQPSLSYRQHDANSIGANTGLVSRAQRYLGFLSGRNRRWNERNLQALEANADLLTAQSRESLSRFTEMREGGLCTRLRSRRKGGFYAQTKSGNFGLIAATLLKKI